MTERQKLDLGGLKATRERPDPAALREISEDHGFLSRDPMPRSVAAPASEPIRARAVASVLPGAPPIASNHLEFRRPGRPASDRLIAVNTRVSTATADAIYRIRDSKPRQTLADVLETLVAFYEEHGGPDRS
jgi:hypothetical protein